MIESLPSGRYRVRVYSSGKLLCSRTFDRKRDATTWEAAQKVAVSAGTWVDPRLLLEAEISKKPLSELITQFNEERRGSIAEHTWDTDEANLRLHLPLKLKAKPPSAIASGELAALWAALLRKGKSRGTVSRIRNSVSSFFSWAELHDHVAENPVRRARLPKGDGQTTSSAQPFTDDELTATLSILGATGELYADAVELMALTGLRFGELAALRVNAAVEIPLPSLSVSRSKTESYTEKRTKSGKARRVPLTTRAQAIVQKWSEGKAPKALLMTGPSGGQLRASNFHRSSHWATAAPGFRLHDLRHTAATNWLQAGVDIKTVSAWLGHSDPAITLRVYIHWMGASADVAGLAMLEAQQAQRSKSPIPLRAVSA